MKQHELSTLDDAKLVWMFVEPMISKARGKDPDIKAQVFKSLNDGQRALFMFQVLYGHAANGIFPFFSYVSFLTDRLDIWSALKSAMNYFDDTEMLSLVEKMETAYFAVSSQDKNTPAMNELDKLYIEMLPRTLNRIGACIRNNPTEFNDTDMSS